MTIKRFIQAERSPRVQPIGKIFKGAEKTGNRPGSNLDYFRFATSGTNSDRLQEVWSQFYGDEPKEINIFFKHDNIDSLIDDWYSEFGTGGLKKTQCNGETITEWRDDRGAYHLNSPKPCRAPNSPKGCDKCKASALIKFGIPEFRYMGYSGNIELSTTSINDIIFLKAQLAEIAAELALVNTSLKYAPLILSRSPRMITKTTTQKQFRGEESLLYLSINPNYQMQVDRAISASKYAEIGGSYEPKKFANIETLALPPAIAVQAEVAPPFWIKLKAACDRCESEEQLEKLIKWLSDNQILRDYPQEESAIAEALAEVQERVKF